MKKSMLVSILTGVLVFVSACTAAETVYWPAFNGEKHDNISMDKGLLKSWPKEGPKLLWKSNKGGKGYAAVTIADGIIFTAGDSNSKTIVTAFDMSGKILWQAENGKAWTGSYPGTRSTPVYSNGMVYQISGGGRLGAFEAKTGKEVWNFDFKSKELKGKAGTWGFSESVTIDGNNLICMPGGPNVLCVALDKKTGKQVWATESIKDNASYCSGIIVNHKGKNMLLTMSANYAVGIDPKDGKLMWKFEYKTSYFVHATTPVYKDGMVYITSGYGTDDKVLKLNDAGTSAEELWTGKKIDNHHGGVVMLDGYIYGAGDKNKGWHCIDMKSGKELWKAEGVGKGSVTYADGMLYCYSEGGQVALVEASTKGYKETGNFKLASEGSDPFWNHPVVIGGMLFLRHESDLFVFDVKGK
ncbi:MAG: PQQ-like beta-propeller repeat protein [Candidatus Firestonebacteria bacterium]|nr:PQQ-like beta-propeller repeat protein [Candidatus Firestonebacteria bacterium]